MNFLLMALTLIAGYTFNAGELWTPAKHNQSIASLDITTLTLTGPTSQLTLDPGTSVQSQIDMYAFASAPRVRGLTSDGPKTASTYPVSGRQLIALQGWGLDQATVTYILAGAFEVQTTETWTASARGTKLRFRNTATGTTTLADVGQWDGLGFNGTTNIAFTGQAQFGNLSTDYGGQGVLFVRGLSKGIRLYTVAGGSVIEGVDNSGTGSYQPLYLGGSAVNFTCSNVQLLTITPSSTVFGLSALTTGGFNLGFYSYDTTTQRPWSMRDDAGINRLRFSRGSSDYWFWDVQKVAASDNVNQQSWRAITQHDWAIGGTTIAAITSTGFNLVGSGTASGGFFVTGGAFAQGAFYYSSSLGTILSGKTGSLTDFAIYNPGGTVPYFQVPTGTNNSQFGGVVQVKNYTVATLPAVGSSQYGHAAVTDATQTLTAGIGAIVAGGGANNVPVYCDGANWRIG